MKLGHIIAAATLLAPIPFAGMTNPATASSVHTVVVSGFFAVKDGGTFPSYNVTRVRFNIPPRTFTLTHSRPSDSLTRRLCAADETRGELRVQMVLQPSQAVDVLAEVKLYEETTCENHDLEGKNWDSIRVTPGQTKQIYLMQVNGEYDSRDNAEAHIIVHQNINSKLVEQYQKICADNPEACKMKIG
ncbi:hypothetical protein ABZ128_28820 [Streptomyces sp. NPDC006326]|uniref:hypothetical protein n=1 Tax=Streptomyces sp. NPDC006326 TaxID=3156752 RepID=UPI0033BF8714